MIRVISSVSIVSMMVRAVTTLVIVGSPECNPYAPIICRMSGSMLISKKQGGKKRRGPNLPGLLLRNLDSDTDIYKIIWFLNFGNLNLIP